MFCFDNTRDVEGLGDLENETLIFLKNKLTMVSMVCQNFEGKCSNNYNVHPHVLLLISLAAQQQTHFFNNAAS